MMADERTRVSDIQDDDLDGRVVDRWPLDPPVKHPVDVPWSYDPDHYRDMPVESDPRQIGYGRWQFDRTFYVLDGEPDPLDWPTLIAGVRGCIGTP